MYKQGKFVFSPTKNYIFTKKERSITQKPRYNLHKSLPAHTNFNIFHPVRPFNRFGKSKIYNTGIDPPSIFVDFINKDPEKPYKRYISPIITDDTQYIPTNPLKWAVGCAKSCNRKEFVPKYDPFKEYNFIKKIKYNNNNNNINTCYNNTNTCSNSISYEKEENDENFDKTYLPTDHISIREPNLSKLKEINKNNFPFLKLKREYNNTSESNSFWVPRNNANKSFSNRSSVDYNIINNLKDNIVGVQKDTMFNKTLHNRKKGIGEFVVSQRPFGPNYNQTFIKLMKDNGSRFRRYKGIFTELYDSAIKNGNIFKPFNEKKEDEVKVKNEKVEQNNKI